MRTLDDIRDEWLVLRCQESDTAALAELVERWHPRLLRHAQRLTGLPDAAGDVVQATWVAILLGLSRLDDPACFRRWAYQIATHKCADWVRERQRDRSGSLTPTAEPIDEKSTVESMQDDTSMIREELKHLPADSRAILSMHYLDELSLAEIADSLSLPIGTVKSRLHYARLKLKGNLERGNT